VLAVVDDLLDRASAVVLGVVARRLAGSRVGFLAVSRSAEDAFFDRGGLPVHEVLPLSDAAAAELVGDWFPALAPQVSQRLLAEAQGNPCPPARSAAGLMRRWPGIWPMSRSAAPGIWPRRRPGPMSGWPACWSRPRSGSGSVVTRPGRSPRCCAPRT
jgi:hypothetical protein